MPRMTSKPDPFRITAVGGRPIATLLFGFAALWMVAEWLLFGLIADQIGWFPTIVLAIFKGGFGLVLLGYVLRRMQLNLRSMSRENVSFSLGEPLLAILGAVLICLPGFVATVIGLALFAPSIRSALIGRFQGAAGAAKTSTPNGQPGLIDLGADDYRELR